MIECLKELCIYQKNDRCMLDNIELDMNGCCDSCICPMIPEEVLEREKEKLRKRLDEEETYL